MITGSRNTAVILVSDKKKKKKSICGFQEVTSTKEKGVGWGGGKKTKLTEKGSQNICAASVISAKL